jgi:hypothetical protein
MDAIARRVYVNDSCYFYQIIQYQTESNMDFVNLDRFWYRKYTRLHFGCSYEINILIFD